VNIKREVRLYFSSVETLRLSFNCRKGGSFGRGKWSPEKIKFSQKIQVPNTAASRPRRKNLNRKRPEALNCVLSPSSGQGCDRKLKALWTKSGRLSFEDPKGTRQTTGNGTFTIERTGEKRGFFKKLKDLELGGKVLVTVVADGSETNNLHRGLHWGGELPGTFTCRFEKRAVG